MTSAFCDDTNGGHDYIVSKESEKQVSTFHMSDLTESPSVLLENCGGSFSFTQVGSPYIHYTCAYSTPTSFESIAI